MTKAIFNIENGVLNKKMGLLLTDETEEIIVYEIDENQRPFRLIGRVKV